MNKNYNEKLKKMSASIKERFENTDWEKLRQEHYQEEIKNLNNFSYWYPKVKDCGIKMVQSNIYQFDYETWKHFNNLESKESEKYCLDYLHELVKNDSICKQNSFVNIKNGTFSNKFDGSTCFTRKDKLPENFCTLQYASQCLETSGTNELVIREIIPFDKRITPTIYNGLPFRTEFRVFVDFDTSEILYIVNYWDYDYCYENLHTLNDKIIFNFMKETIENDYNESKNHVIHLVKDYLLNYNSTQENKLIGRWSVDIMKNDNEYYLIDMAIAYRSAYWNPDLIKKDSL